MGSSVWISTTWLGEITCLIQDPTRIQLDPEDFPAAYLYNAVANARLDKVAEAEHAAREGIRIDKERKFARLSYVLGLLLMQKHEYGESAKYRSEEHTSG